MRHSHLFKVILHFLFQHYVKVHGPRQHVCPGCTFQFGYEHDLKRHVERSCPVLRKQRPDSGISDRTVVSSSPAPGDLVSSAPAPGDLVSSSPAPGDLVSSAPALSASDGSVSSASSPVSSSPASNNPGTGPSPREKRQGRKPGRRTYSGEFRNRFPQVIIVPRPCGYLVPVVPFMMSRVPESTRKRRLEPSPSPSKSTVAVETQTVATRNGVNVIVDNLSSRAIYRQSTASQV